MKKTIVYVNGKVDKTMTAKFNRKPYKSLTSIIERRKRCERDARLVKFF